MKKNVLVFGLISGIIVSVFMVCSMAYCAKHPEYESGMSMVVGYAAMLLALSLIFVAVKNYRDEYNNGVVTFGKAFQIGLYISLICSTIYVIVWLFDYYLFMPDFMDKYAAHMIANAQKSGATAAELAAKTKEINDMKEMYKNPVMIVLFTYVEILPVGLIVSLIVAAILNRKTPARNVAVSV